ncbi:MAG TPA: GDSL-type esterase/lipase family protein [Caulobacteraceae bacterium]
MASVPPYHSRRAVLAGLTGLPLAAPAQAAAKPVVITILGDSITAGYGLKAEEALPAQLQAALGRIGVRTLVRGAGVSGDTTAGGLGRLDFSVQGDTALCIVALGGNDLLQGLDPNATRANLEAIARRLKARRIGVLLCGLRAPARMNAGFARAFNAAFPAAARAEAAPFYPDLLAGVELIPGLNQGDGLHPNARGVKIIAARLAPVAARALRTRR